MAGPCNSAQRVPVRHAGGTIKLPLLPADSVKSLRSQLQLFGLRPCELPSFAHCVRLKDEQTMAQADILDGDRAVFMTKDPPAAADAAAASSSAAGGAGGDGWSLWVHYRPRPLQIFVRQLISSRALRRVVAAPVDWNCGLLLTLFPWFRLFLLSGQVADGQNNLSHCAPARVD